MDKILPIVLVIGGIVILYKYKPHKLVLNKTKNYAEPTLQRDETGKIEKFKPLQRKMNSIFETPELEGTGMWWVNKNDKIDFQWLKDMLDRKKNV